MKDAVLDKLAEGVFKCPLCAEIFDSELKLRLHLCESHKSEICQTRRVRHAHTLLGIERPNKLVFCSQCLEFNAPEPFVVADSPNAMNEIDRHIRVEHPRPGAPTILSFKISEDSTLIDKFVEESGFQDVCACSRCGNIFDDEASVALHWAEKYCEAATTEEMRRAFVADPERFRIPLAEALAEVAQGEIRQRLSVRAPDDGYLIHHGPNVPRVRSRPSEQIIFVEQEIVELSDQEIEELLECEGLDAADTILTDEVWSESKHRTVCIDLRFCNILDGYIPLVRAVREILPPLAEGETIEVSWQDNPEFWFPCTVSKTKRAIYNLEGRLKHLFELLPSGVKFYVTRVGTRRYRLHLKHQPHIVRNCKIFVSDGQGGWKFEFRDENVEWETGDEVFRHQLTFQQMDALYHEARTTGLSVRDAVYEVMKRLAQSERVHVRTVHDAVFLWMRTCSLASVWAQFRPEHKCYVRVAPGWYKFVPTQPLPIVRIVAPPVSEMSASRTYSRPYSREADRYRIKSRSWRLNIFESRLEEYQNDPDAYLEVRCGFGSPNERVFVIPISYLMKHVIPNADRYKLGRYLFTVNQNDFVFTWDHGFRMDGKLFLDRSGLVDSNDNLFV